MRPGVDQVFHQHDVAPGEVEIDVVEDAHATGVGRVARDGDERDLHVDVADRAREVGEEDRRALQHPHEHHAVGVVGGDLLGEAGDGGDDGGLVEQGLGLGDALLAHSARVSRTASRSSAVRSCRPSDASSPSSSCSRARASGLRCRTYGSSTWPKSTASRSANVRYMRR